MTQSNQSLFADHAYLPDGWRRNVLLEWDANGTITAVTPDTTTVPAGVRKAAGPVLPGMPNLHSHAFQRAMAGLTEYRAASGAGATDNFWSWRDLMYRFAARITPEGLASVAQWLYIEMLKAGYTSVCEFHYVHHTPEGSRYANPAELAQRVVDAASASGIGMTMLPVLYQYSGFGSRAPRDDQRRFINTPEGLLDLLGTLRAARPESAALRYGVAPHSLRAVSAQSLQTLLGGLDATAPVHIHIAEQTAEVDACIETEGARPVQWLLDRFDVDSRWCLVHATHVADRLFDAALDGGTRATGRAVGALQAGHRADWLVLDANHSSIAEHAPAAWLSGVVFCEHGETPIRDVYAGGDKVVDNRRHRDEEGAYARYRAALADLLK